MSALKRVVQKEVFGDTEETLLFVCVIVKKIKKSHKKNFACLTVTNEKPFKASLHFVSSKEKFSIKKKNSIELSKLRKINGISPDDNYEFVLTFTDKFIKIMTCSSVDKENFIHNIVKIAKNYYHSLKLVIENCSNIEIRTSIIAHNKTLTADSIGKDTSVEATDENKKPTNRIGDEDLYLIDFIDNYDGVLTNVDDFINKLNVEIEQLDYINISAILSSETNACELMSFIDFCLLEIDQLETQLSFHERHLLTLLPQIKSLQSSDALKEIKSENIRKLHDFINETKNKLEISDECLKMLNEMKFDSISDQLIFAIQKLYNILKCNLPSALFEHPCIRRRFETLQMLRSSFCERFWEYAFNLITSEFHKVTPEIHPTQKLSYPNHESVYCSIKHLSIINHQLKLLSPPSFYKIQSFYSSTSNKLYEEEFRQLFDAFVSLSSQKQAKSDENDEYSNKPLLKFEQTLKNFEIFIHQLIKIMKNEEDFITEFFDFTFNQSQVHLNVEDEKRISNVTTFENSLEKSTNSLELCMKSIFTNFDNDLVNSLNFLIKVEPQLVIIVFAIIRDQENQFSKKKAEGFVCKYIGSLLVQWSLIFKRSFDVYVSFLCKIIGEKKHLKKKDKTIHSISIFESFKDQIELVSVNLEKKSDLYRSYKQIVVALIESIESFAYEQDKTHPLVIIIENLHHLQDRVNQLKISYLDNEKKLIKTKYKKAVGELALFWLGKPMEKLSIFFEAVQRKIDEGIRPEDISYQFSFNRQELKKILKEYSAKEVKKGVEAVYKRLSKSIDDHGIIQVVWHEIQCNFVQQFKCFNELLQKCYSDGVPISMDISLDDIMTIFANVQ